MPITGDQFDGVDEFFWLRTFEQKRIGQDSFVRETAATGFFPCKMLVVECDVEARTGQAFTTQGSRWASAHDGNLPHLQTRRTPFFAVAWQDAGEEVAAIECDRPSERLRRSIPPKETEAPAATQRSARFEIVVAGPACYNFCAGQGRSCQPIAEPMGRVVTQTELITRVGREHRGQQRVVFTNGCFDLLHPGHVRLLEQASLLGDLLVVGANSDRSVRALKGDARPLLPEEERAELLAALAAVDYVVIFDQETPREIIAALLPEVLVKGADWDAGEIVGREEVEAVGGKVVSIPLEPGYSTTKILEQIRALPGKPSGPAAR